MKNEATSRVTKSISRSLNISGQIKLMPKLHATFHLNLLGGVKSISIRNVW